MKKSVLLFLMLALALTCCVAQAEEVHQYPNCGGEVLQAPTCTEYGRARHLLDGQYDQDGNQLFYECRLAPLGHDFSQWRADAAPSCGETVELYEYCSRCGAKSGNTKQSEPQDHIWGEWKTISTATCIKKEVQERACVVCGATQTQEVGEVDKTVHNYGEVQIESAAKDCQTPGKGYRLCKDCREARVEVKVPGDHVKVYKVVEPETCTKHGVARFECSICGELLSEDIEIPMKEHNWEHLDYSDDPELVGHIKSKHPTCEEQGIEMYKCSVCGFTRFDYVSALGHDWMGWEKRNDPAPEDAGAGIAGTPGYWINTCRRCGKVDYKIDYLQETKKENVVEASCETEGSYDEVVCTEDGTEISRTKVIVPALGHELEHVDAVAATNSTAGNVAYDKCTRCGKLFVDGKEVAASDVTVNPTGGFDEKTGTLYDADGSMADYTGIYTYKGEKFFLKGGVVDKTVSGVQMPSSGTWYVFDKGWVVSSATGFITYGDQAFVCENGALKVGYNGLYDYNGGKFLVSEGRWRKDINGLTLVGNTWYYMREGMIQKDTGLVSYDGAIFYIKDGVLASDYTGVVKDFNGTPFNVYKGMVR